MRKIMPCISIKCRSHVRIVPRLEALVLQDSEPQTNSKNVEVLLTTYWLMEWQLIPFRVCP